MPVCGLKCDSASQCTAPLVDVPMQSMSEVQFGTHTLSLGALVRPFHPLSAQCESWKTSQSWSLKHNRCTLPSVHREHLPSDVMMNGVTPCSRSSVDVVGQATHLTTSVCPATGLTWTT